MIGIVVSGHIHFATGIQSAVKAITGEQDQIQFIDFVEALSTDELEVKLRQAAKEVDNGDGVLFLTDIPGGSPANRALNIMLDTENVELITGVNLPLVANAALEREGVTLDELVEILLEIGRTSIQDMRKELEKVMVPELECEDGL